MILRLEHIGIAVKNQEAATILFEKLLGNLQYISENLELSVLISTETAILSVSRVAEPKPVIDCNINSDFLFCKTKELIDLKRHYIQKSVILQPN